MSFNTKQKILVAKEEVTYGTDSTPVGTDAVDCRNIKINYRADVIERNTHRGSISAVAPRVGKRWIEISFEADLMGSGVAGVAPEIGDLLEACGFTETIGGSNGSSIIYTPKSNSIKSVTMKVYEQFSSTSSKLHVLTGARGDVNFQFDAGKMATAQFTFRAKYNTPLDVANITPTYDAVSQNIAPPIVEGGALLFNSTSFVVQSAGVNLGNSVVDLDDISTANTLKEIRIVSRRATGKFNPEAVMQATYSFVADWIASTQRALTFNVGATNLNKIAVSMPKVTLDGIDEGELNGSRIEDIPIKVNQNTGDDELSLTFS